MLVLGTATAGAITIQVDNFDTMQGPVVDLTADGNAASAPQVTYSLNGNSFDRDQSISLLPDFLAPPEVSPK